MSSYRFEDSIAWQKAQELALIIYGLFKDSRDFGFKDQITRAAVSISNNIAEGFERSTEQELQHFLYIARGSCGEVRSMLYLALKLNYINEVDSKKLHLLAIETSKLIYSSIKRSK